MHDRFSVYNPSTGLAVKLFSIAWPIPRRRCITMFVESPASKMDGLVYVCVMKPSEMSEWFLPVNL